MGTCNFKAEATETTRGRLYTGISKRNFTFHCVIGKGGFGKVWKTTCQATKEHLAMKEMNKRKIVAKRSVQSVLNERKLLSMLKHPFIVNMHYAYQDKENLYLGLDLLLGGDLRYQLSRNRRFTEEQSKFFVICLLLALEYIHLHGVIHRDIKPENLVLDRCGYLRVTDFGISRVWQPNNAAETSGTPGYMAPEVICRMNHTMAADYFAVGVIVYELMMGRRPYAGKTRKEIRDAIISKQVQLRDRQVPPGWSTEAASFANRLLVRKPRRRMGYNGPHELKNHAWLAGVNWKDYSERRVTPPFVPLAVDNFDSWSVLDEWKDSLDNMGSGSVNEYFTGYMFDKNLQPEFEDVTLYK